jgi:uncharacterized cupredoxin-like copper-binding protein
MWRWSVGALIAALVLMLGFSLATPRAVAQEGTPSASVGECPTGLTPAPSPAATADATTAAMTEATPTAGNCVTIGMHDIYFDPNLVTIPADTPVTIVLPNKGAALHDFSVTDHKNPGVPNLNIAVTVDPGKTLSVTLQAKPGTYYFYCNQPGHEAAGMFGYLIVKENAKISAERATVTPPAGS